MSIPSGKENDQVIAENDTTGGLRSSLNDIIIERLVYPSRFSILVLCQQEP